MIHRTVSKYFVVFLLWGGSFLSMSLEAAYMPRTVIAIYDGQLHKDIYETDIHQMAEMPLNHLGIVVEYHDVHNPLPKIEERPDIIGVITWYDQSIENVDPKEYIHWIQEVIESGKKYVLLGNFGFEISDDNFPVIEANRFWKMFGMHTEGEWAKNSYDIHFIQENKSLVGFEKKRLEEKLPFLIKRPIDQAITSHLIARYQDNPEQDTSLIVTSPHGGYIDYGYACYSRFQEGTEFRQWFVNPFLFFREVFDTDQLPKPDVTTLAGRRIFYSQVDGDGWNNISRVEKYRKENTLCAEVILQEVIIPGGDLPVSVAPIAAEIAMNWEGTEKSRQVATDFFRLPHVEVACHTYTHPFDWAFFKHYKKENEIPFLEKYRERGWGKVKEGAWTWLTMFLKERFKKSPPLKASDQTFSLEEGFEVPRAYGQTPFNLRYEVVDAVKEIESLAPPEKKVKLYQWSGDTLPFESIIKLTREAGLQNINGGDTRFDRAFPSYAWVMPIGRQVGLERQIYASASNENTYTNLWKEEFYGANLLPETFKNTDVPKRIKPIDLYYHMYSGERLPSLKALLGNLQKIREEETTPVHASHYAQIAEGFYTTKIAKLENRKWQIEDRGELQTIRFDRCTLCSVDFTQSEGVIGERHYQGSLYVYLDADISSPIITLKDTDIDYEEPKEGVAYLIDSRWCIWNKKDIEDDGFSFLAQGFGEGEMRWRVFSSGRYEILVEKDKDTHRIIENAQDEVLSFRIPLSAIQPVKITISRVLDE